MLKTLFIILIMGAIVTMSVPHKPKEMSELDTLAATIHSECSNCDLTEMYLVGSVILNRCNSDMFPNEINHVVHEYNQFHGVGTSHYRPTEKTRKVAQDLLQGLYITPDILFFCTYNSEQPMGTVTIRGKRHIYGK